MRRASAPRPGPRPAGADRSGCDPASSGPMVGAVGGYLIGHWLGNVIASGYIQVQGAAAERSRGRPGSRVGGHGVDGRDRRAHLPAGQGARLRALPGTARDQLGPLLPHDRRPQGGRLAVRGRGPHLPLHRRLAGHAHPHRAVEPDQPRLRPGDLHRHRERARHDHDDDGVVRRRRASRELAGPADDRLTAHGLPTRRVLLVLDLHGGIPRHRERPVLRRLPHRVDGLRAAADAGPTRHGFVPGRLCGDRHRHDPRRLQPRRHHRQLPGAGHDLGQGPHLRLGHPGHDRPAHPGDADPGRGRPLRHPRPHGRDRVLRHRARRQQFPLAEPLLVLRPPRGLHHGPARLRDRDGDHAGLHAQTALCLQGRGGRHARRRAPLVLRLAAPPLPEWDQPGHATAVHADDRAHLHPDRLPVPGHAGHAVESEDQVRHSDAVLPRDAVQLPDRRRHRRVPLGRTRST